MEYNLALTSTGELYGWGNNDSGQLGNNNTSHAETPSLIRFPDNIKIKDFSCGDNYVGAITYERKLYTWGYGSDG